MSEKLVLIGGSPTAGKSYIAEKIAKDLRAPWVSTDTIRSQMMKIVRKEDYPNLFIHENPTSEMCVDFLTNNSVEEIVEVQNKESEDVWKGVKALVERDRYWDLFVVEGVAVLPHLVADFVKKGKNIKVLFLIDEDVERVRETIFTRGLWGDADEYPDEVKEKEVEWVLAFNEYVKREAERFGFPVVSVGNRRDYVDEIRRIIE